MDDNVFDDFDDVTVEEVYDDFLDSPEYDDFLSQFDDDPSPYDGNYSEE